MAIELLCDAARSQLVVIDVQERLAKAMNGNDRERVVKNTGVLLQAADTLAIPAVLTEQYPRGLGPTEPALREHLGSETPVLEKTCFACSGAERFDDTLAAAGRPQVVIAGIESHVCVVQSALTLHAGGYHVFVAEDACCSRNAAHHSNAMARLRQAGVVVSNTESILFEWLRDARHEHFKTLSALIK